MNGKLLIVLIVILVLLGGYLIFSGIGTNSGLGSTLGLIGQQNINQTKQTADKSQIATSNEFSEQNSPFYESIHIKTNSSGKKVGAVGSSNQNSHNSLAEQQNSSDYCDVCVD